jgi:hypothetical protein
MIRLLRNDRRVVVEHDPEDRDLANSNVGVANGELNRGIGYVLMCGAACLRRSPRAT